LILITSNLGWVCLDIEMLNGRLPIGAHTHNPDRRFADGFFTLPLASAFDLASDAIARRMLD
jgi:hypothetical protein